MRYGRYAGAALLYVIIVLPVPTGGAADGISASSSARITLRLPPRAVLSSTGDPGTGQLCLDRIPANSYYVSVRNVGELMPNEQRLVGQAGRYCIPIDMLQEGTMVLIAAE